MEEIELLVAVSASSSVVEAREAMWVYIIWFFCEPPLCSKFKNDIRGDTKEDFFW